MAELTPKLRSITEAVDELQREFNVRARCFPRWVSEGRVSATDAQDRLDRLHTALSHLRKLQDLAEPDAFRPKEGDDAQSS